MFNILSRLTITAAAFIYLSSLSFAQVSFQGYVPHKEAEPTLDLKKQNGMNSWYNGEDHKTRFLTLGIDQTPKDLSLPASTLIVPGSGTIPNSKFLSETLEILGFEAPKSPYILLNTLTHSHVEVYAFEDMIGYLYAQPNGSIFILGLDFQTGFIHKEGGELLFLSPNTSGSMAHATEKLEVAINNTHDQVFVIGDLSERARILIGIDPI